MEEGGVEDLATKEDYDNGREYKRKNELGNACIYCETAVSGTRRGEPP